LRAERVVGGCDHNLIGHRDGLVRGHQLGELLRPELALEEETPQTLTITIRIGLRP
jgi:hypothetical protein